MVLTRKQFGLVPAELEFRNRSTMNLTAIIVFFSIGFFFLGTAYAQETASIDVTIENTKGDRVDHYEMTLFVFEQGKNTPLLEINPTSNPYTIDSLDFGKKYQIDVYVNNMYGDSAFVTLDKSKKSVTIPIPISGGLRFTVFYGDAYTPIDGASVSLASHDGKIWRSGITSEDGKTMRFWMQPTNPSEYYKIDVSLGKDLVFHGPKVSLTPSSQPEIKIVTNWPPIVDSLIIIESYNYNAQKISKSDGDFIVELYDVQNNLVDSSPVNHRGESFFSNLKVGEYTLKLIKTSYGPAFLEEWGSKTISISGAESGFSLEAIPEEPPISETPAQENTESSTKTPVPEQGEKQNCNCVAFRLDDVQDYWLSNSQMQIINLFQEKEIPLTIGIVGGLIGEDDVIVNFLKEKLAPGNPHLELANHSWSDIRLTEMTKSEQNTAIQLTNEKIFEIFGKKPTTFIPPGNLFNQETIDVLIENSFSHLSASYVTDTPSYSLSGSSFYHLPQTAETGSYDTGDSHFVGVPYNETFDDVQASIAQHGYAIVMLHPQEFSVWRDGALQNEVNENQIQELEKLISKLNEERIDIVPIGKLNLDAKDREQFVYRYTPTCDCISFRLDTVQDWWLADVNMAIIEKFNQKQIPLTIGIIGNFIGTDPTLVEFLQGTLKQNPGMEIANNGWSYEDFTQFDKDQQKGFLVQSNDSIQQALGVHPTVFVPPHNRHNDSTLTALKELGFTHISSAQTLSEPPYTFEKESFYHFPLTVNTGLYDAENFRFEGLPYETTLQATKNSIAEYGYAVLSLDPQVFAMFEDGQVIDQVNSGQLNELEKLLKTLTKSNFEIVPISKINIDSIGSLEIPNWIKNNAGWWADGQITDSDFTLGIEFMIKENIIKLPEMPKTESISEQQVPDWIKNNAGWWALDLITDEDFVNGIEYLVKKGIILV